MAIETRLINSGQKVAFTTQAAVVGGEIVRLDDGRAARISSDAASGALVAADPEGILYCPKTANYMFLRGQEIWWDVSANKAHYYSTGTGDFYLGLATADAAEAATVCYVDLNRQSRYLIDTARNSRFISTPVDTTGYMSALPAGGGGVTAKFSLTAEAQKFDLLSVDSFAVTDNWIYEAWVNLVLTADADVCDVVFGVASASHASDPDAIATSAFFHLDLGADLNIDCESDNVAAEVAATDSTIDIAAGTPVHLMMDGRNPADIQMYINGALVLGSTVFTTATITTPQYALFLMEKSANDSPGILTLQRMSVRLVDDT